MKDFRLLKASEIDVRIAQIHTSDKGNGVSLLLYKDARVDQNLLDETVGSLNWQRSHQIIDGRLYCTVSIWDDDKKQWVEKQDVGTESYTEKEKGQASDSFKRACFNWGIGRELYTAPFIYVDDKNCKIKEKNGKKTCYDKFVVKEIQYDEDKNITQLVIRNTSNSKDVFTFGKKSAQTKKSEEAPTEEATEPIVEMASNKDKKIFIATCQQLKVDPLEIAKQVGVGEQMTAEQYAKCMVILQEIREGRAE